MFGLFVVFVAALLVCDAKEGCVPTRSLIVRLGDGLHCSFFKKTIFYFDFIFKIKTFSFGIISYSRNCSRIGRIF